MMAARMWAMVTPDAEDWEFPNLRSELVRDWVCRLDEWRAAAVVLDVMRGPRIERPAVWL